MYVCILTYARFGRNMKHTSPLGSPSFMFDGSGGGGGREGRAKGLITGEMRGD